MQKANLQVLVWTLEILTIFCRIFLVPLSISTPPYFNSKLMLNASKLRFYFPRVEQPRRYSPCAILRYTVEIESLPWAPCRARIAYSSARLADPTDFCRSGNSFIAEESTSISFRKIIQQLCMKSRSPFLVLCNRNVRNGFSGLQGTFLTYLFWIFSTFFFLKP